MTRRYPNRGAGGQLDEETALEEETSAAELAVYARIKQGLIKRGIPAEQIAFVHDAKKPQARQELFNRVNNGDIRVIIGSTAKMGAGTNFHYPEKKCHELKKKVSQMTDKDLQAEAYEFLELFGTLKELEAIAKIEDLLARDESKRQNESTEEGNAQAEENAQEEITPETPTEETAKPDGAIDFETGEFTNYGDDEPYPGALIKYDEFLDLLYGLEWSQFLPPLVRNKPEELAGKYNGREDYEQPRLAGTGEQSRTLPRTRQGGGHYRRATPSLP